jgi:hypothetical protein
MSRRSNLWSDCCLPKKLVRLEARFCLFKSEVIRRKESKKYVKQDLLLIHSFIVCYFLGLFDWP